ncbi:UNVERIFIED_CONTAM: hypothetical protein K2H54_059246 [Gekko kuhli]
MDSTPSPHPQKNPAVGRGEENLEVHIKIIFKGTIITLVGKFKPPTLCHSLSLLLLIFKNLGNVIPRCPIIMFTLVPKDMEMYLPTFLPSLYCSHLVHFI